MATLFLAVWSVVAIVAGVWFGLKLPDFDQRTDLLLHRSIITHGPLAPMVLFVLLRNARSNSIRLFPMFVCLGMVVHLAFDLFPRAWWGYALISVPVYGWLPAWLSIFWMACSALACSYWAFRLANGLLMSLVAVFGAVGIFLYAAPGENAIAGPAVVVAGSLAVGGVASLLRAANDPNDAGP